MKSYTINTNIIKKIVTRNNTIKVKERERENLNNLKSFNHKVFNFNLCIVSIVCVLVMLSTFIIYL